MQNRVYIHALLRGLTSSQWLEEWMPLDAAEQQRLHRALELGGLEKTDVTLQPLSSILGHVWGQQLDRYFQPTKLQLSEESVLPQSEAPIFPAGIADKVQGELEALKAKLQGQKQQLDAAYYQALAYAIYHEVAVWGARVSLGANGTSDVSLFDQNRVLAATVNCLELSDNQANFLLVKGAVSGIQSYIYNDIKGEEVGEADNSSKKLRGRSFLVAHLSQVIAEYLVEELDLNLANILFIGGGHFNLLFPDTPAVREKLQDLQKRINLGLIENLGLQLNLVMAWESVGASLFSDAGGTFRKLGEQLGVNKLQKNLDYLDKVVSPALKQQQLKRKLESQEEKLGQLAPYSKYLLEVQIAPEWLESLKRLRKPDLHALGFLNRYFYLFREKEASDLGTFLQNLAKSDGRVKLTRLNETDFLPDDQMPVPYPVSFGFQFIGNYAPETLDGKVMLFEDIARLSERGITSLDFPQLAAMRLDVDDLGTLFGFGLGMHSELNRVVCLSREFQLFFGGYFNELAKKHHLYITYSGGDDAFVIGSWLNTVKFAAALNKAFRVFSCNNPEVGFSAGIFLCHPHYPVVRFAKDAEKLEKNAKGYLPPDQNGLPQKDAVGKDAICVFNHTLSWPRFEEMMQFAEALYAVTPKESDEGKSLKGKRIRRSMLQRLLSIMQVSRDDEFEFYRNIGRLHGLMSRHKFTTREERASQQENAARLVQELLQETREQHRFIDYIVPVQYVLYKTRVINQ